MAIVKSPALASVPRHDFFSNGDTHRHSHETYANNDRREDISKVPDCIRRHTNRFHTDIVHGANGNARYTSADDRSRSTDSRAVADRAEHDRNKSREDRENRIVLRRQARLVGKHGYEMRSPNSATCDNPRCGEPDESGLADCPLCAPNHAHRCGAREKAQEAREGDEPEIVLICNAGQDVKHSS